MSILKSSATADFLLRPLWIGLAARALLVGAVLAVCAGLIVFDRAPDVAEAQSNPPSIHLRTCQTAVKQTSSSQPGLTGDLATDCAWLLAMKPEFDQRIRSDTPTLNWGPAAAIANWQRVGVSGTPPRVTAIHWRGEDRIMRKIPPDLNNITGLERLTFYGEYRYELVVETEGGIPDLGRLTQLESFTVYALRMTGVIHPSIMSLTSHSLKTIDLSDNNLSGYIPSTVQTPTALESLNLGTNNLSGPIPNFLCNATNLKTLELGFNRFTSLPPCLGSATSLEKIEIVYNDLSGPIPMGLDGATNLKNINLEENRLTGSIPPELGNLPQLTNLNLYGNRLTGSIPPELGDAENLTGLQLSKNQLTGPIPSKLGDATKLTGLGLSRNQLSGAIPSTLANLTELEGLRLNDNMLDGEIPTALNALTKLMWFNVGNNKLTGQIPDFFTSFPALYELELHENQFTGTIPTSLGSVATLRKLRLDGNRLTGTVPTVVIDHVTELQIQNNEFTGTIQVPANKTFGRLRMDLTQLPIGGLYMQIGLIPVYFDIDDDALPLGADKSKTWVALEADYLLDFIEHAISDPFYKHEHNADAVVTDDAEDPAGFKICVPHPSDETDCITRHVYLSLRPHDAEGNAMRVGMRKPAEVCLGINPRGDELTRNPGDDPYLTLVHYDNHDIGWYPVHRPESLPAGFTEDDACGEVNDITGYSVFARGLGIRPPVDVELGARGMTVTVVRIGDATVYVKVPAGAAADGSRLSIYASSRQTTPTGRLNNAIDVGGTVVAIRVREATGNRVDLRYPATVCMNVPAALTGKLALYHLGDSAGAKWQRLKWPDRSTVLRGYREGFACGLTREFSRVVPTSAAEYDNQGITLITPEIPSVTVSPGNVIRLRVNVYGKQLILDNTLGDYVPFYWSITPSGGKFEEGDPGATDDADVDEREVFLTAPTSPGRYRVKAKLDNWDCDDDGRDDGCYAEIEVTVRTPLLEAEPTVVPANPIGEIPSIIADSNGNQYEVFAPVEGGIFVGEDVTVSADSGAIPNGEVIGVRAEAAGFASNVGQAHHRVTLEGRYYTISAVDATGKPLNGYVLDDPVTVCIPLPSRLASRVSDVAMVSARDSGNFTVLGSKVKLNDDGITICGAISELSAKIAAGYIGSPSQLPTPTPTPEPETPETGGAAPSTAAILLLILLGTAIATISLSIVNVKKTSKDVEL